MRIFGRQSTRDLRTCRGCGCDDDHACDGGCSWVLLDIDAPTGVCSACADAVGWDPRTLMMLEVDDLETAGPAHA